MLVETFREDAGSRQRKAVRPSTSTKRSPQSDHAATLYARRVLAGLVVAGPYVRAAAERHLNDLRDGHKRGLRFDPLEADRAIAFFETQLFLAGGQFEGKRFKLHESQKFKIASIFGWKRADGTRRFRRAYIEEGKGNGKSPLSAGIGLYGLVADREARAEVYSVASKRDQAMVLFRDAVAMVDQSPELLKRVLKSGTNPVYNLAHMRSGSFFRPLSADHRTQSGPRPHFILADEIHEMESRTLLDTLELGFKFRRQPLLVMTTNSGSDRKSVCFQEHQYAIDVVTGKVDDDATFAFVCSLDEDDNPLENPDVWPKANPLLGVTITREWLAANAAQAASIPGKANIIKRLNFCIWTDADTAWMTRKALEDALADFDPTEHRGKKLHIGLDLSERQDLTAMGCVVETGEIEIDREQPDGSIERVKAPTFDAWVEAWTPRDTVRERAERDKAPYEEWIAQGFLNATRGKIINLASVAKRVVNLNSEFLLQWLAFDRYAFDKFREELEEMGAGDIPTITHPQGGKRRGPPPEDEVEEAKRMGLTKDDAGYPKGLWMPGSILEFETLILEKRIRIRRSPVAISAIMSVVLQEDDFNNRWFVKSKATNRIDPAVALAMAIGSATRQQGAKMNLDEFFRNVVAA
jgi:phage terminase large subunit-like protein